MIVCRARQISDCFVHPLKPLRLSRLGLAMFRVLMFAAFVRGYGALAEDLDLSPTRPTVSNGSSIQGKGILQLEAGYDAYPGDEHTVGTLLTYTPFQRLRLDLGWSAFSREESEEGSSTGVGTIQAGGKAVLFEEKHHHAAPGLAIQYEAEFPAASTSSLQEFGQQITLLVNHHYGPNGILNVILNGSLVQSDCQTREGCHYGGQQAFALSYHLQERTRLYAEVFGQNNSQSNTPPGIYCFGGVYRKLTDSFGIDGGLRFGITSHSPRIGATIGVVLGRRLGVASPGDRQP